MTQRGSDRGRKRGGMGSCAGATAVGRSFLGARAPALLALVSFACAADPAYERRVSAIEATLSEAERLGALQCAPRELALARAHLGFARFERERGHRARAEEHLAVSEPNADAAVYLSPPGRCSEGPPTDASEAPLPDAADLPVEDPEPSRGTPDPPAALDEVDVPDGAVTPDRDADGVPDAEDECPGVPGEAGAACPSGYAGLVVQSERVVLLRQVVLDPSGAPDEATSALLRAVVDALRDRPAMVLEVGAHTSSDGTELENLASSQRRAERVRALLVQLGADPQRVHARGYGEELPIESNGTPEGRAANDRIEMRRMDAGASGF